MADHAALTPVSGFAAFALPGRESRHAGLLVAERRGLGLATVTLRIGAEAEFAARVGDACGLSLRQGPVVSVGPQIALVGTGPHRWLASRPGGGWRFAAELGVTLAGLASVADQSSGYAVLRLSGQKVRDVLAKGVPIDLDGSVFGPGDAAVTLAGHVGIVLWQVADDPVYDIAVFRSMAGDFWHWLAASASEFGMSVGAPID